MIVAGTCETNMDFINVCFSVFRTPQVIIYNWPGLPNKQTMLNDLILMIKAAEKVVQEEDSEGNVRSKGNGKPTFGHLIILMRDVDGKATEIEELVLGAEQTADLRFSEEGEAEHRNRIRRNLKAAFESITFHTMPIPHPDITGKEGGHVLAVYG